MDPHDEERVLLEKVAAAAPSELAPSILRLAEIGSPAIVVPHIAGFVWLKEQRLAQVATAAMSTLLRRARTRDLLEIDEGVRARSPYFAGNSAGHWLRVSPKELTRLRLQGGSFVWLLGYASFHASGYATKPFDC